MNYKRFFTFILAGLVFLPVQFGFCQDRTEQIKKADGNFKLNERLIGFTFRNMARAFVLTQDLDKTKSDLVGKISKMNEEKFYSFYYDFYEHVYDLQFLVNKYKLCEDMPRDEVIKAIKSLDKNVLYEVIDNIPDKIITREFNRYMRYAKKDGEDMNKLEQLSKALGRMIEKIKSKYSKVTVGSDIP